MSDEDIELAVAEILASLVVVSEYHMSFSGLGFSCSLFKELKTIDAAVLVLGNVDGQAGGGAHGDTVLRATGHETSKKTWPRSHKFRGESLEDVIRQFVVWASKCQT